MKRHLILAAGGAAAAVLAFILGLWPVHTDTNGVTLDCGSALRPKHAMDTYSSAEDPGGLGMLAVQAIDEECEAARSDTTTGGRVLGFVAFGCVLALAGLRPRREPQDPS